ncbi:MAG: hypothetical protein ACLFOY_09445 [Desulfatibacillaceae bacterium]
MVNGDAERRAGMSHRPSSFCSIRLSIRNRQSAFRNRKFPPKRTCRSEIRGTRALTGYPPVLYSAFRWATMMERFQAMTSWLKLEDAAEQATASKDEALQALTDDMKDDLRYAENTVDYDDKQIKKIGWGGRASKTSLEAPGQVRTLEAPR